MKKWYKAEEAVELIKKFGCKIVNENFAIVSESANGYKGFYVGGNVIDIKKTICEDGTVDHEIRTLKANPLAVKRNWVCEDGIVGDLCRIKSLKKDKVVDCDTWTQYYNWCR